MGSPITNGTWDGFTGSYYTGFGSGMEGIWLAISIILCLVALFVGVKHEKEAYARSEME
ncbi:MAG: hypothetical protein OIF40_07065 [Mangrovicoccus sp.]|nr:hypothetical protein [Mangrovicoccus sp.]